MSPPAASVYYRHHFSEGPDPILWCYFTELFSCPYDRIHIGLRTRRLCSEQLELFVSVDHLSSTRELSLEGKYLMIGALFWYYFPFLSPDRLI